MHFYENRGSASAAPAPAEPTHLDLPDAAPWTGNWSHLIAAWLFGAVILGGMVVFVMHFGAIQIFVATLRRASPIWLAANWRPTSAQPLFGSASFSGPDLPGHFRACSGLRWSSFLPIRRSPSVGSAVASWSCAASCAAAYPPQSPLRRSSLLRCHTTPPISWSACSRSSCFGIAAT